MYSKTTELINPKFNIEIQLFEFSYHTKKNIKEVIKSISKIV